MKKFSFRDDKLNELVTNIKVQHIPDTNQLISIKTYSQIVESSVDLAEEEFIRITFENRKGTPFHNSILLLFIFFLFFFFFYLYL